MSKRGWFGTAVAKGGVTGAASYVTTTYIIPLGTPIVAGVIGYASGYPWFYIFLGALAAFAFVSTGLLRFSEWRYRQDVKDKLNFYSVHIKKKLNSLGYVESLGLGFQLQNSALVPVECELLSLHTNIDKKFPPKKERPTKKHLIPAGSSLWIHDFGIELPEPIRDKSVEGLIDFVISYGRLGRLRYELRKKLQIFLGFDPRVTLRR